MCIRDRLNNVPGREKFLAVLNRGFLRFLVGNAVVTELEVRGVAGDHRVENAADDGICQDTSKKLVRSLFIPEEPQQGLCPYASLPQDIFLT